MAHLRIWTSINTHQGWSASPRGPSYQGAKVLPRVGLNPTPIRVIQGLYGGYIGII